MELFNHEQFNDLKKGLDELYENLGKDIDYGFLDEDNFSFGGGELLPTIYNSNINHNKPGSIDADLGLHIKFISVYLYHILPSMVMLKIIAYFDDNTSDKLNEIIYKYHESEIVYHDIFKNPNKNLVSSYKSTIYGADKVKTEEITTFRSSLKKEVLNFFSNYFRGFFLELSSNDPIVPSIEIYSLDYPNENEDIVKWTKKCHGFLKCFQIFILPFNCYKLDDEKNSYLFINEDLKKRFMNHFIFMNHDDSNYILELLPFEFVAFNRWLQIQEQKIAKFGSILSEEIENLEKNKLDDILKNRKIISKSIFQFERFKTEFKLIEPYDNDFKLLENKEYDLSTSRMEEISERIESVNEIIYTYNKHFNIVLGLKNVEYSKNMQNKVYFLTFVVIFLTGVQILTAFKTEITSFINQLLLIKIIGYLFYIIT